MTSGSGREYRSVVRTVAGQQATDGAGVRINRVIGNASLDHLDPFLLLDEFRSDDPDDYIAGFPNHPHRGFETVTYMLAGSMEHRDNQGNSGLLGPGSVQWMTAGRGIVHSELPRQEAGLMWGFQLWVNLPARNKLCDPRYQDIPAADVPLVVTDVGISVRVIAGRFGGEAGPVKGVATQPLYLDVSLPEGTAAELPLPDGHAAFVYCFSGNVDVGADDRIARLSRGELGVLEQRGERLRLCASGESRCLVVAAEPLDEPIARYGPFVMNTRQELEQAVDDFRRDRF